MNHLFKINDPSGHPERSEGSLSNKQLLENFSLVVLKEREAICEVISYLSHIWERKLYAQAGYSSLFNFLVEKYHYSKGAAYRRYQAAKLVLREPKVLEYLKEARLTLTTIGLIESFAKDKRQKELIEASLNKTKESGMTKKLESRYIPQELRQEIWKRDKGKCTFQSKDGRQCNEQGMIEVDHVQPFALGGNNNLENLRLICASHNKWRAEKTFGFMFE